MFTAEDLDRERVIYEELLESRVMAEQDAKPYARICLERLLAYRRHVGSMVMPKSILMWAEKMAMKTGRLEIKVWHNRMPWLEALMVIRYGEAVDQWPTELSALDIERAYRWLRDGLPANVSLR